MAMAVAAPTALMTLESTCNQEVPSEYEDPYDAHLARTFVPISGCQRTE